MQLFVKIHTEKQEIFGFLCNFLYLCIVERKPNYNNISSSNTPKRTRVLQVWSDKVERRVEGIQEPEMTKRVLCNIINIAMA
jgi:hypothetical protein